LLLLPKVLLGQALLLFVPCTERRVPIHSPDCLGPVVIVVADGFLAWVLVVVRPRESMSLPGLLLGSCNALSPRTSLVVVGVAGIRVLFFLTDMLHQACHVFFCSLKTGSCVFGVDS